MISRPMCNISNVTSQCLTVGMETVTLQLNFDKLAHSRSWHRIRRPSSLVDLLFLRRLRTGTSSFVSLQASFSYRSGRYILRVNGECFSLSSFPVEWAKTTATHTGLHAGPQAAVTSGGKPASCFSQEAVQWTRQERTFLFQWKIKARALLDIM